MQILINPKFRMMSEIHRWQNMPLHRQQDIANHSYYVGIYVRELCKILEVPELQRLRLIEWAQDHDVPELETGDFCGPVKRQVIDISKLDAYEARVYAGFGIVPVTDLTPFEKDIIKAADELDAVWQMAWEKALGNRMVNNSHKAISRLQQRLGDLGLENLFHEIDKAVSEHVAHPNLDWSRSAPV